MRIIIRIYLITFLSLFSILSFGQNVIVSYLKTVPVKSFRNTKDSVIAYPVFQSTNKIFTDNINKVVKSEFYKMYDKKSSESVKMVLKSLAKDGLVELSYGENRNDNRFFSFEIYQEWIAAYPTYNQIYYTFDKKTGERLTIDSLILPQKMKEFKAMVIKMWKISLTNYRKDILDQLKNKIIDSTGYELALGYLKDDCLQSYSSKNFKLNKSTIEIFFDCSFPRVMRTMDPSDKIILPLGKINNFLRQKYRP